jgi:hypothetical protein
MSCSVLAFSDILLQLGIEDDPTDHQKMIAQRAVAVSEATVAYELGYNPLLGTRTKERYPQGDYGTTYRESVWETTSTHAYQRRLAAGRTDQLFLKGLPVRSVTSLWIDYDARFGKRSGSFAAGDLKVEGTDFWAEYDGARVF